MQLGYVYPETIQEIVERVRAHEAVKRIKRELRRLPPLSADVRARAAQQFPELRDLPPDLPVVPSPPLVPDKKYMSDDDRRTERLIRFQESAKPIVNPVQLRLL